jgi:hypothetical protein
MKSIELGFWIIASGLLLTLLAGCQAGPTPTIEPSATPAASVATPTLTPPTVEPTIAANSPVMPTPTLPPPAEPTPAANQSIITPEFEGVIFSQENAAAGAGLVYGAEAYWTPVEADILALEAQLDSYLQQNAPQDYPGPLLALGAYKRQYVGFVSEGKQLIFANFFCETHGQDWQQTFIAVEDGGPCYFEIEYDPQTETFSSLLIHGQS